MDNMTDTFGRLKHHQPPRPLSDDFEDRVFARIKRKKKQRKVATVAVMSVTLFAFLFIAQAVFFNRRPETPLLTAREEASIEKEEVPVMEDVIFASSDNRTDYAVEQVNYNEENITI